jgi:hypothetical protein
LALEAPLACDQFFEVHLMAVEVRAVHTREPHCPADGDATGTAHSGAVDHDRVERHHRLHAEGAGGLDARVHHRQRTDGDDEVGFVRPEDLLERGGYEPGRAVAAVVGADDQVVAVRGEPVLPEHQVLVAEADNAGNPVAGLLEGAELRVDRRDAEPAADQHDVADLVDVLRQAERPHEVVEGVAPPVAVAHLERRLAERLDHQCDGAALSVVVGDGERDAFTALVQAEHDEVPWPCRPGDVGRQHLPEEGGIGERLAADDPVHLRHLCTLRCARD